MNTKITKQRVNKDFIKLKELAKKCYDKKDYYQTLSTIETASKLMYAFNISYTDDDMEEMLSNIAYEVLKSNTRKIPPNNGRKIILYDFFAMDNRGLTQQYIMALIDLDYEILFITYQRDSMKQSEQIFLQLKLYKKAQIYTIKNKEYIESSKEMYNVIKKFGATKALIHTSPWDVVGIMTFSYLTEVERYLINLTDHAFWLGKCCSDYILEFRSYGYNISKNYRNIKEEKLMLLPYYPVQDLTIPFEGFPFDTIGKKVIFSGGAVYKIYGSNIFFDTIKHIVEKHDDTIVMYAGGGNTKPFKNFIVNNHLEKRVFLISERKDISQIFKNCYFYLGTYPLCGGLMTQYAVANNKIPIAFADEKIKCNFIESLFINVKNRVLTYTKLKKYYDTIDKLIDEPKYKNELENNLNDLIITRAEFAENLLSSLEKKSTKFSFIKYDIDINEFSNLYFKMENDYLHNYYSIFIGSRNVKLILKFMNIHLLNVLIKTIINKLIKKLTKKL